MNRFGLVNRDIIALTQSLTRVFLTLDKDESSWEVMSSISSRNDRGYSRVMTRLLKQSKQLVMVMNGLLRKFITALISVSPALPYKVLCTTYGDSKVILLSQLRYCNQD